MSRFRLYVLAMMLLLLVGCEHRPLVEVTDSHYIRIYLNERILNVSHGFYDENMVKPEYKTPRVMRVTLSDTETGKVISDHFLQQQGSDERGNYIEGYINAQPGVYNLLAYNFDTESTHIRNEQSYKDMEVYTNAIDEKLKAKIQSARSIEDSRAEEIRYEPDHFFITDIPNVQLETNYRKDTIKTLQGNYPVAESVVKTYYLQVNVKGVEYVRTAIALITGMAGSVKLHNRAMVADNPSTIYFNLQNGRASSKGSEETTTVGYATFNTFGKLPEVEGYIEITFEFRTSDDKVQTEVIRVTDIFETPEVKEKQWIIIDKVIEIDPPEDITGSDGGMAPGVSQWEQIESGIII